MRKLPSAGIGFPVGAIGFILALAVSAGAPAALADGDPASDVLVTQQLFDPWDVSLPAATSARLRASLAAAARAGFPIRVALINSTTDLGTVTQLWSRPGVYARYLGTELSDVYGGQVLVVMPDGFGLYAPAKGPGAASAAEAAVTAPRPGPGPELATAALAALGRLASAAGHPIPVADIRQAPAAPAAGGAGASAWLAVLAGLLLIALAWAASLSRRPLQWRHRASA